MPSNAPLPPDATARAGVRLASADPGEYSGSLLIAPRRYSGEKCPYRFAVSFGSLWRMIFCVSVRLAPAWISRVAAVCLRSRHRTRRATGFGQSFAWCAGQRRTGVCAGAVSQWAHPRRRQTCSHPVTMRARARPAHGGSHSGWQGRRIVRAVQQSSRDDGNPSSREVDPRHRLSQNLHSELLLCRGDSGNVSTDRYVHSCQQPLCPQPGPSDVRAGGWSVGPALFGAGPFVREGR